MEYKTLVRRKSTQEILFNIPFEKTDKPILNRRAAIKTLKAALPTVKEDALQLVDAALPGLKHLPDSIKEKMYKGAIDAVEDLAYSVVFKHPYSGMLIAIECTMTEEEYLDQGRIIEYELYEHFNYNTGGKAVDIFCSGTADGKELHPILPDNFNPDYNLTEFRSVA